MTHRDILAKFEKYVPHYSEQVKEWFPNGKNSIRIRTYIGHDYIFTYISQYNWSFETIDHYIDRMTKESKRAKGD